VVPNAPPPATVAFVAAETNWRSQEAKHANPLARSPSPLPRRYVSVAYFERRALSREREERILAENLGPERRAHGNNSLIDSGSSTVRTRWPWTRPSIVTDAFGNRFADTLEGGEGG